jgi:guanylate kinase
MVNNVLVIISGSSGVGKSETAKRLLNYQDLNIKELIGFTTRPPRPGEVEGKDYYFISKEEFLKKVANNQVFAHAEYNDNHYGTPLNGVKKGLLTKNILQVATVEVFQKLKATWSESKIISF